MLVKKISLLVGVVFLAGCAARQDEKPHVSVSFTNFTQIDVKDMPGKRLIILPSTEAQGRHTLEFETYRSSFYKNLTAKGLIIVSDESEADWVGHMVYAIDGGKENTDVVSVPQFGMTGGGTTSYSGNTYGSGGYGSYSGTSSTVPTFGVTGYTAQTVRSTSYTRRVGFEVYDKSGTAAGSPKKIYEGMAVSSGRCGSLAGVFDAIAEGFLKGWPGENGKAGTMDVDWGGNC